jgi:DNA (cytosine-5)-methyltransferase 1
MTITHYDLFAGIGGFSLALEEIFTDAAIRHIFCEWESFPTSVLRQHWPDGEFYGDIADLVAHTERPRPPHRLPEPKQRQKGQSSQLGNDDDRDVTDGHTGTGRQIPSKDFTIVTGGFPCQPFSHAGRRKGTADDRYQWPNMYAVIRNTQPEWVIAENVRGLVTWNDGLVLETVCADLESEGYEVQPFIIPAVAVGAPHRRDRVWIIGRNSAYAHSFGISNGLSKVQGTDGEVPERHDHAQPGDPGGQPDKHPEHPRQHGAEDSQSPAKGGDSQQAGQDEPLEPQRPGGIRTEDAIARSYPDWSRNWQEVAFATCDDTVDDGLSRLVDGVPMSRSKWRQNSLKAYGNGIVAQVAMEIMRAIKETHEENYVK